MITHKMLKEVKSLSQKKYREQSGHFVVEGYKSVTELLKTNLELVHLWTASDKEKIQHPAEIEITAKQLKAVSSLRNSPGYLAVFKQPVNTIDENASLILALDDIQDPGNLGTIIRLCDWFNIKNVICSTNTVDLYNPKTVQATMSSIVRINIIYTDLQHYAATTDRKIYAAVMNGSSIYNEKISEPALLIMGNESHGIKRQLSDAATTISIPQYGEETTESLNVATATGIILAQFNRATGK